MSKYLNNTILVVDDIDSNIKILVDTLGNMYNVAVAMNGEAALQAVKENPPDLILLDIMMPGMDGFEVCRRLKTDKQAANIPVIFVTAKAEMEDEQKGLDLGAVDYIIKPVSPPLVRARVKNHIALKEAHDHLEELVNLRTRQLNMKVQELEGRDQLVRFQMKSPDIETAVQEILRIVSDVIEVDGSSLYLPTPSGTALKKSVSTPSPLGRKENASTDKDKGMQLATKAFQQKKVVVGQNRQMAAPMIFSDEIFGVIWLVTSASQEEIEDTPNILWRMALEAAAVMRMAKFSAYLHDDDAVLDRLLAFAEKNLS